MGNASYCKAAKCTKYIVVGGYCQTHAKIYCPDLLQAKKDKLSVPVKPVQTVPVPVQPDEPSNDTQNIPENIPGPETSLTVNTPKSVDTPLRKSPLDRLESDGWLVEIPRTMAVELHEIGMVPENIEELLQLFIDGQLRRVA